MRILPLVLTLLAAPVAADAPRVVADIAPIHSLVARVMEGVGTPDLILPPGASPHGYAMRPSEARALSSADLVVWVGPALTPWLAGPVETLAAEAQHLDLMAAPDMTLRAFRTGEMFEDHDDHDHGHDDDHDDHAKEEGVAADPHIWLDPQNGIIILRHVAETLAEIDPDNAPLYRDNASAGAAEITALQARIAADLDGLAGRPFVVSHDAYHYFEARFGVEASAAISLADGAAAGAAHLSEVRDTIAAVDARCALVEPQAPQGLIDAVFADNGVKVQEIDGLGSKNDVGAKLYTATLTQISDALARCLAD